MNTDLRDSGATNRDSTLHRLDAQQGKAVVAIAGGATHDAAAEVAGVHRTIITRWANHHPAFVAEAALDVVETEITSGSVDAAFSWLKLANRSSVIAVPAGPTASVGVVEAVRRSMPTTLDSLHLDSDRASVTDAERLIQSKLENPYQG